MYYIRAEFFYYSTQLYAPENGPLKSRNGDKLIFDSIQEAQKYLYDLDINWHVKNRTYTYHEQYLADHGEYARPLYTIRKVRKATNKG